MASSAGGSGVSRFLATDDGVRRRADAMTRRRRCAPESDLA